jgi:hypothetical protein
LVQILSLASKNSVSFCYQVQQASGVDEPLLDRAA